MSNGLLCYNRGCGKVFDPKDNPEDACVHHSGSPVFHDAYKSWSCCGKKTTDFSTFLGTVGCTQGRHSNVKTQEPVKITGDTTPAPEIQKEPSPVPAPIDSLPRPSFDRDLCRISPTIDSFLVSESNNVKSMVVESNGDEKMSPDEPCKNKGCKITFSLSLSESRCKFHDGVPIFHEGMKFWSCCQRKTSDFESFLNQEGCQIGAHKWIEEKSSEVKECRNDWHQTENYVTVSVYAKNYCVKNSYVDLNPIRLVVHISFPDNGGVFHLDKELKGIIKPEETYVTMNKAKVEIKMRKAELCSWSAVFIPKSNNAPEPKVPNTITAVEDKVDALDLEDLEMTSEKSTLSFEASGGRTGARIV